MAGISRNSIPQKTRRAILVHIEKIVKKYGFKEYRTVSNSFLQSKRLQRVMTMQVEEELAKIDQKLGKGGRMRERWTVEEISVGDYIEVEIDNKRGDRNLDGMIVSGVVKDLVPSHKMVRLENGWCCHTKDILIVHRSKAKKEG